MNRDLLNLVIQGQSERNILDKSKKTYLSKCKVMMRLLNNCEATRYDALIFDDDGVPLEHTGLAAGIFKLKLPITEQTAQDLFAMISVDDTLPRQCGKRRRLDEVDNNDIDIENDEEIDPKNPGKNKMTVTPQTYQNYKSALKWWHEYTCEEMDKVGAFWSREVELATKKATATYKRDIGTKKRKGIMVQKEGKRPYNLFGYITISKYFMKMAPVGNFC